MKKLIFGLAILAFLVSSRPGQSITHQTGWICTYNALGNYFEVFMTNFCPPSINVN